MFEQKLAELQRGNTIDSLKEHEKYAELEQHIENAIQSANGWFMLLLYLCGGGHHIVHVGEIAFCVLWDVMV